MQNDHRGYWDDPTALWRMRVAALRSQRNKMQIGATFKYKAAEVEHVEKEVKSAGGFYLEIVIDNKPAKVPKTVSVQLDGVTLIFGSNYSFQVNDSTLYLPGFGRHVAKSHDDNERLMQIKDKLPKLFDKLADQLVGGTSGPLRPAGCVDLRTNQPIPEQSKRDIQVIYAFFDPIVSKESEEISKPDRVYFSWDGPMPDHPIFGKSADESFHVYCKESYVSCSITGKTLKFGNYGWKKLPKDVTEQQAREAFRDLASKMLDLAPPKDAEHWPVVAKTSVQLV